MRPSLTRVVAFPSLFLVGVAATAPTTASAITLEISLVASQFVGFEGWWITGETPPQEEVIGSFSLATDDDDGVPGEVHDVYTVPLASDLSIAGIDYGPEDLQAYLGFRDTQLESIQVGGTAQYQGEGGPAVAVHIATATTDDFVLVLELDAQGQLVTPNLERPLTFAYSTSTTTSFFRPFSVTISLSIDGAAPQQVTATAAIPDPTVCFEAQPAGDSLADAVVGDAEVDVRPGGSYCKPPDEEIDSQHAASTPDSQRAASAPASLRDAKVPAGAALTGVPSRVTVTTALGTLALEAKRVDRLLLAASAGESESVEAPEGPAALRCAKVKTAAGTPRFARLRNVPAGDGRFHIGAPTRLCVDPEDAANQLLCYRARRAGASRSQAADLWVAHALGKERLAVARAKEICLKAE